MTLKRRYFADWGLEVERLPRISFGGFGFGREWLGKAVLPGRLSEVMGCVLSCRFLGLATSAVHDHHGEARSCDFHPALHSRQTDLRWSLLLSRSSDWSGVIRVKLFLCAQGA